MTTTTKNNTIYSLRINKVLRGNLEREAKLEVRPLSYIMLELAESYIDYKKEKRARIQEAIEEIDRGETIPGEKVMEAMRKWSKSKTNLPFVFENYV